MDKQEETVRDVVCGMVKPVGQMPFKSEFNGKLYYFCSKQDKDMFDQHPGRWVGGGEKD